MKSKKKEEELQDHEDLKAFFEEFEIEHPNMIKKDGFANEMMENQQVKSLSALGSVDNHTIHHYSGMKLYEVEKFKAAMEKFSEEIGEEQEEKILSLPVAMFGLGAVTVLISICAEFMLGSIQGVATKAGLSELFIGTIILPVAGNAAEHVCAVSAALRDKMDLAIGICVGSSVQIALGVTPFLVLFGWMISTPMSLDYGAFDVTVLFLTVLVVNYIIKDGCTNWFEGFLLMICYICIAVAFYYFKPGDLFVGSQG